MIQKIKNQQIRITTPFDINDQRLINVATPSGSTDGVNKNYVDTTSTNSAVGTGIYSGCMMSIVDGTHFAITSGIGYFIDPETKIAAQIVIPAYSSVTLMTFGSNIITISVGILPNGSVFQQTPIFSAYQRRIIICLGELVVEPSSQKLYSVSMETVFSWDTSSFVDNSINTGIKNISGNSITPSGSSLSMNISSGSMYGYSVNAINSYSNPNERSYSGETTFVFEPTYYNSTEWVYLPTGRTVNPGLYSNGTTSLQTVPNNKWSLRMFMRGAYTSKIWMSYPTQTDVYPDSATAIAGIADINVTIPDEIVGKVLPICFLIVKGSATNLSDTNEAVFVPISSTVVTASGSMSVLAMDVVFDNSLSSGLTSINVQNAIDEVNTKIENINYSTSNLDMPALSGTSGIYKATNGTITDTPKTWVRVEVNGLEVTVGNGTVNAPCYFSSDGGTTPKSYSNVVIGDSLYWNRNVALYNLENSDLISFVYMTF